MKTQHKSLYEIHRDEQEEAAMASLKKFCKELRKELPWRDRLVLFLYERFVAIALWLFR